ncbi:MAG: tetratricopeptide repeat protein [Candidatus Omnitrophica bacterium]|nr:tetratricopeptide repeat protein [Candidatus Omnitrophota bacterium]
MWNNPKLRFVCQILLLVIVGVLIYSNSLHSDFVFDDKIFVAGNPNLHKLTDFKALWHSQPGSSRIVAVISFALNYHFTKLNVVGFHATNLVFHLINGFLVWWLICLLFETPVLKRHRFYESRNVIAWICALLFVVHPLQTQAVAYITQRFASLATLFYVLGMCWYLVGRLSGRKRFYVLACGSTALSMLTKEMAMTFPLMVIMTEWVLFEHQRVEWRKMLFGGAALLGLGMIVPAVMRFNIFAALFDPKPGNSHLWDTVMFEPFVMTQLKVWVVLLAKLFVPIHQNLDYDFPLVNNFWQMDIWGSAVILIALLVFAVKYRQKSPLVSYGIFWFFVAMSVEMIPRMYVIFEHKMYLPMAGLSMALVGLSWEWIKNNKARGIVLAGVIILFGVLSYHRNFVWKDEVSLWGDVVKHSPNKPTANYNLGCAYQEKGMLDKALYYFNRTAALSRYEYSALVNRSMVREQLGDSDGALDDLNRVLLMKNDQFEAYNNRGTLYGKRQEYGKAVMDLSKALYLRPESAETYYNRGSAFQVLNKLPEALNDFTKSIQLKPDYSRAYISRGIVNMMLGRDAEAGQDFTTAIELEPYFPNSYMNRGILEMKLGYAKQAGMDLSRAVALNPNLGMARYDLFLIFKSVGLNDKAAEQAKYIIEHNLDVDARSKAEIQKFFMK